MVLKIDVSKEDFIRNIEENYVHYQKYINYYPDIFGEFRIHIVEISKCLAVKAFCASITLTNHTIEKLLKFALIKNAQKLYGSAYDDQDYWEVPHTKYKNFTMYESVCECFKEELISEDQKKYINELVKEQFRNGFSHFDTDKILKNYPDKIELLPTYTITKADSAYKLTYTLMFAEKNALIYLDFLIELIQNLELNLLKKYPNNRTTFEIKNK